MAIDKTQAYEDHRRRASERGASVSRAGREIGEIPDVVDPKRRKRAEKSLRKFCEYYFPDKFNLKWSKDHLVVIDKIESTVIGRQTQAIAMPRGSGKTTLCEVACIWAIVYGYHEFVFLIGATMPNAIGNLDNIKSELQYNDLLMEDFPEVCMPIRALENEARRCTGQLCDGRPTDIGWTADELVLPTIEGSQASGAIVRVAGITGNIRGALRTKPDGTSIRPTLAVLDDPQTDQSAYSPAQCKTRLATINGAVMGLAGPGKRMAAIMPCTVIREGDIADELLDRMRSPLWRGERTKMVYEFPSNTKLWDQYQELRNDSFAADGQGEEATAFYKKNRKKMDAGAAVAWPERFDTDTELSGLQNAMNIFFRDEYAFAAEYQNDPLPDDESSIELMSADQISRKISKLKAGVVPLHCEHLTMYVDVQGKLLYYMICAWGANFSGSVLEYGCWPDQNKRFYTLRNATKTLMMMKKGAGQDGAIRAGLDTLIPKIMGRVWHREDGLEMQVSQGLIDSGWKTDVVGAYIRTAGYANLQQSKGVGISASDKPMAEHRKRKGDRNGFHWRIPSASGTRTYRTVNIDVNFWKTFYHQRLGIPIGDPGCLTLYGTSIKEHRQLADHLLAEYPVKTEGRGRTVDEWKAKPGHPDNHLGDCLVGNVVCASMLGATLSGGMHQAKKKKKKRKRKEATYL